MSKLFSDPTSSSSILDQYPEKTGCKKTKVMTHINDVDTREVTSWSFFTKNGTGHFIQVFQLKCPQHVGAACPASAAHSAGSLASIHVFLCHGVSAEAKTNWLRSVSVGMLCLAVRDRLLMKTTNNSWQEVLGRMTTV